jgi:hypothetical protein
MSRRYCSIHSWLSSKGFLRRAAPVANGMRKIKPLNKNVSRRPPAPYRQYPSKKSQKGSLTCGLHRCSVGRSAAANSDIFRAGVSDAIGQERRFSCGDACVPTSAAAAGPVEGGQREGYLGGVLSGVQEIVKFRLLFGSPRPRLRWRS